MSAKIPLSIMFVTALLGCVLMWKIGRRTEVSSTARAPALVVFLGVPNGR